MRPGPRGTRWWWGRNRRARWRGRDAGGPWVETIPGYRLRRSDPSWPSGGPPLVVTHGLEPPALEAPLDPHTLRLELGVEPVITVGHTPRLPSALQARGELPPLPFPCGLQRRVFEDEADTQPLLAPPHARGLVEQHEHPLKQVVGGVHQGRRNEHTNALGTTTPAP